MAHTFKGSVLLLLLSGIILIAGCSGSTSNSSPSSTQATAQSANQPAAQPASTSSPGQNPTSNNTAAQPQSLLPNRVDVIYFHVNQRCPTCLCFEDHVNKVIEKYFGDAIVKGKLTYKVLNAQKAENAAISRQYGVVGSQLFINVVKDNKDHIEDVEDIWNWNCRNNGPGFELKVKDVIEYNLKGLP